MTSFLARLVTMMSLVGAPTTSPAADIEPSKQKLAVFPLAAVRGVEPDVTKILTNMLVVRIDQTGRYEILSADELGSLLGLEKLRDTVGCDDVACAAEVGGALGSDLMLTGSVGRLGTKLSVSLTLFDVRQAKVLRRAHRLRTDIEDEYSVMVAETVDELLDWGKPTMVGTKVQPAPEEPAERWVFEPVTPTNVPTIEATSGDRAWGIGLTAAGGALIGLGGVSTWLAKRAGDSYSSTWKADDARQSRIWAAAMYSSYAVGLAAATMGLLTWLRSDGETAAPTPSATATVGGMLVGLEGGW